MRAGRNINRRQIAVQLHRLVGRSKKHTQGDEALSL